MPALLPSALWAAEAEPAAPTKGIPVPDPVAITGLSQMVIGLVVVLALIFVAAWLFKRFGRMPFVANGAMRVVGVLSMGTREKLVLVQVGEEQLLVGVAPGQMRTLHVLKKPIDPDENKHGGESAFGTKLAEIMKGRSA